MQITAPKADKTPIFINNSIKLKYSNQQILQTADFHIIYIKYLYY